MAGCWGLGTRAGYDRLMLAAILAASPVWHYWIGLVLLLATGLLLLAVVVGYLVRVQSPQYPKRRRG